MSPSHLIQYASGDGNDTIVGFNETDTLTITGGSYSTATSGFDVIVTVGKGKILLVGAKGKSLYINKTGTTKVITLTGNEDYYLNSCSRVKIKGGAGNDYISNSGSNVSISGGDGDDTISGGFIIYGDAGDDSLSGDRVYGGEGNDTINGGSEVHGGDGNDLISLSSGNKSVVMYSAGDGDDKIYGFNGNSTLSTTGGYSSTKSGNNIIVTVGDGKITMVDAASLSYVKIINEYNPLLIVGSKSNDSLNQILASATIKALDGDDSVTNCGANVSLFGGTGNDTIYNKTNYTEEKTRPVTKTVSVPVPVYDEVDETITASEMVGRIDKEIKEINDSIQSYMDNANNYYEWAKDGLTDWWNGQGDKATLATNNLRTGILKDKQDERKKYDSLDGDSTMKTGNTIQQQTGWTKKDSIVTSTETYSVTHQTSNTGTTISGGEGDDYIINSASDFVYSYTVGDGNNVIFGFDDKDTLRLDNLDFKASYKNDALTLKFTDGSITLKDFSATTFHINGDAYKINGSKLKKQ